MNCLYIHFDYQDLQIDCHDMTNGQLLYALAKALPEATPVFGSYDNQITFDGLIWIEDRYYLSTMIYDLCVYNI